jgi:hypothetical protein
MLLLSNTYNVIFAQVGLVLPLIFGLPAPKLPSRVFALVQSFLSGVEIFPIYPQNLSDVTTFR